MLETIAVTSIILWLLALVTSHTFNGFIHLLLVAAVLCILFKIIGGEKK